MKMFAEFTDHGRLSFFPLEEFPETIYAQNTIGQS